MDKLLIIKTENSEKVRSVLAKNHIEHQVIYDEPLTEPKSKKDKIDN